VSNNKLKHTEDDILNGCLRNEPFFQELLYKVNSKKMFGGCMRYAPNRDVAHDIFQEGFIKVFNSLNQFKRQSSLSSWMYRIFVNTSINYIQRSIKSKFEVSINDNLNITEDVVSEIENEHWINHISSSEALDLVQQLPEKYRLIINLFAIEKHSHSEISKILNITEVSSRSQLSRARKLLSEKLKIELKLKLGE
jgi:RNA polymerase sigma-70 factor (ECF subfamily)